MKDSKYFKQAHEISNEEFLGFDAYEDEQESWENVDGDDWEGANAFGDQLPASGADRGLGVSSKGESQPYIIQVKNTTTADITDVVILDAAAKQSASSPNYGNTAGISITYELPNITYTQFLASIASGQTFESGQLRLVASASSSSVAEAQVLTTVTVSTSDLNGNLISRPFIPQKDSYQQIPTQIDLYYRFMANALTSISFATISAGITLKVYIYPYAKVNQFRQVKGGSGAVKYRNPKVNPILRRTR